MIELVRHSIDVAGVELSVQDDTCGASLVFVGRVRGMYKGAEVLFLEYEAYEEMALQCMQKIANVVKERWNGNVAIVHRLGTVYPNQVSVVISVTTPHRAACYEANRYVLEALKQEVPIWKKEITPQGGIWKGNKSIPT